MEQKHPISDDEWKKRLTPEQYHVLREKGTEQPFSGEYWDSDAEGVYVCAGCGEPLFNSETKFKSGTGWPSFTEPVDLKAVVQKEAAGFFADRIEVLCHSCGGHLGHLFHDGPKPSGNRYCLNSVALVFKKKTKDS